ncbi:hypothetical protein GCK32_018872 [Trichostrongylus colubriformis]|uniref:Uncharacterized protein n=1 Tax=Trichostrongylus colubriformis TaxID=6319 RepID=A0AAN8FZ59_TRICO
MVKASTKLGSGKYHKFIGEPMDGKKVSEIFGVGDHYGGILTAAGYTTAERLYGVYLSNNRDKARFMSWLEAWVDKENAESIYECLNDYAGIHGGYN